MARRNNYADFFLDLLPALEVVSKNRYMEWPSQKDKYFKVMDIGAKSFINMSGISELGLPMTRTEGGPVTFDEFRELFDKKFTPIGYALGMDMTRELIDQDAYGLFGDAGAALAKSFRLGDEIIAAEIWDNSTLTTQDRYKSADGVAIHSASHPIDGGASTASNILAAASDLAMTSLEALMLVGEDTVNDRGVQMMLQFNRLVVPSELRFVATKLLGDQMYRGDPSVVEHSITPLADDNLYSDIYRYQTDPDAWTLWSDAMMNEVVGWVWVKQQDFDLDSDVDIKTQTAFLVATDRKTAGVNEWRGSAKSVGGVAP